MIVGFIAASYSIVANDAIQTLGTFLSSNAKRPWWVLWLFSCGIMVAVMIYGWFSYGGDISYGRLSNKFPVPDQFTLIHAIPPIVIIFLTRYGIPVSTTFLVLTVFAPAALSKILTKSLMGYGVAFLSGVIIYLLASKVLEQRFIKEAKEGKKPANYWTTMQWVSTGFLWSQWLIQDLANIFVYMPTRTLSVPMLAASLVVLLVLHAIIFYRRGGEIQHIVTAKTNTTDIRSATIIDFIYGIILFMFKEVSNIPMSTTWVFLGLLGGRELAITIRLAVRSKSGTFSIIAKDIQKASIGLAVSVMLAFGLPRLEKAIDNPSLSEPEAAEVRDIQSPIAQFSAAHSASDNLDSEQSTEAPL